MTRFYLSARNTVWFLTIFLALGCAKQSQKIEFKRLQELPVELQNESALVEKSDFDSSNPLKKTKAFQIPKPQFKLLKNGSFLPALPNSETLSQGHRPRVPILKYSFQVPQQMKAKVELVGPEMEMSEVSVKLAQSEKPLVWGKREVEFVDSNPKRYFPGRLVESYQTGNRVYVTLFPFQVDLDTGKVLTLSKGSWSVSLAKEKTRPVKKEHLPAVIITSEKLLEGAKKLQKFHLELLGVQSEIKTVESISKSESVISLSELPEGYKSPEKFDREVRKFNEEKGSGYNFLLARKIISFLRKQADENPVFRYVVILGNSEIVPPSYYFAEEGGKWNSRTGVTDQCYSAGKQCLEPRLAVGRLPFRNDEEVENYLGKARKWVKESNWFESELALYGGKAFKSSPFYIGELGTLVTVNPEETDWKNVQKHFETDSRFTKEEIRKLVQGEEKASLVYYLDHGTGNRWWAGEQYLTSFEIKAAEPKEGSVAPVMVSVACINAAFDEELLIDRTIPDIGQFGVVSIGTALLKSKAGAVAYLGGSRDGLGSPETEVDEKGNVEVLGTSYGLQMFDGFVASYRKSSNKRLGDALLESFEGYLFKSGNDMEDFNHRWTYWITELLGDPLMPIQQKKSEDKGYPLPQSDFDQFDNTTGFPRLSLDGESERAVSKFPIAQAGGAVTAKLFEMILDDEGFSGQNLVKAVSLAGGTENFEIQLGKDLAPEKQYMIKLVNEEGVPRERHIVFSTKRAKGSKEK